VTTTTAGKHPAPFTDSIIDALANIIPHHAPDHALIHDPFAGEGLKLAALCERLGYMFSGTDLESWPDRDRRVHVGDSTDPSTYPLGDWWAVVTSPTYNNGVNDHFEPKDTSRRLTYRSRLGRALHPNNTGRWSGRSSKKGEAEYWRITNDVIKHWPDTVIVNVKDSIREGSVYPLVQMWTNTLIAHYYVVEQRDVECPGWRYGANGQERIDIESILIGKRS
jgi:hypothetical protein